MGDSIRRSSWRAHMMLPVLDGLKVVRVVLEDDQVLGVQVVAQAVALQDGMELLQQRHRVLGGGDMLKAAVHKALHTDRERMEVPCGPQCAS
eukprot:1158208-Pelagomonas_calceolata.AAC.45